MTEKPLDISHIPHHCQLCAQRPKSAFQNLGAETLDHLSHLKTCVAFKKGKTFIKEGVHSNGVFCIHKGKLKLHRLGSEGKEQIVRFATKGELVGYCGVLSEEPISVSATALEDTYACYIPKKSIFELIEKNPKFSLELLKISCHQLGEAGKIITSLAQKNVRERLAETLLLLHATFGKDEEGFINIELTRAEIANMVGTATESAIRVLAEFKKDGLILMNGKRIKIEDGKALQKAAAIFD